MATDHDFKIKNGARVSGEKLILGSSAYSADNNYVGLKTSAMTGSTEYMIISSPGDKHTYISAGSGRAVYIRGGGNNTSHQLVIDSAGASFAGNLTVSGNFTVTGTTTTLNTATLNVEDKNIVLNYGSGDTSASANYAGITIQDAVNGSTDATINWHQSGSFFNFSHNINTDGYLQHVSYLYSRNNLRVLNAAGNGWHDWATRSNGTFNLNVGTISSGAITTTTGAVTVRYGSTPNISLTPTSTGGVINARNSSGTSVVVMDARGTPFLDVTGNLKTSGTVRIDSSGNATLGTISSGTITTPRVQYTDSGNGVGWYITTDSSSGGRAYIVLDSDSSDGVGSGSDYVYIGTNSSTLLGNLTLQGGGLNVGGQIVINSSRNLTNIGTISSGAITSSGNLVFSGNSRSITMVGGDTNSQPSIAIGEQNLYGYRQRWDSGQKVIFEGWWASSTSGAVNRDFGYLNANNKKWRFNDYVGINVDANTTYRLYVNGNIRADGAYYVGGSTVIDSSRNLTNIGTISSGAITATGTTTLSGLTVDGAASVKYANSSGFGNQTFSYAAQGFDAFQIYNDNSTSSTSADQFVSLHMRADGAGNASARMVLRNDNSGNGRLYFMLRSGAHTAITQPKMLITDDGQVTISDNATTYNERLFVDGNLRVEGVYKSGTQTIIDASRNLTNIGTISSGAITSTTTAATSIIANRSNGGVVIDIQKNGVRSGSIGTQGTNLAINSAGSGGYGRLQDNGTDVAVWWTNGIYPATDNTKNLGVSATSGRWQNLFMANGIYMAGSQIVDSSRNLTNIGTISSGAITSSGNSIITGSGSTGDALTVVRGNNGTTQALRVANAGQVIVSGNYLYASHSGTSFYSQGTAVFRGNITNDGGNNLSISSGGSDITFNSKNFTSVGTISSGAITSTGNITGAGLIIDGSTAVDKSGNYTVFYDGSGNPALYAGNTVDNRNYYQASAHRFRSDDASTTFAELSSAGLRIGGASTPAEKLHVESGNIRADGAYLVSGTTVIDSSRNLTNIGTISSGAITSSGDVKLNGDTKKYAAPVYRDTVTGISNSGYTTLFTVDGGGLASSIRLTLSGTTGSVVVNLTADISVGHYQDILITSRSGFYTTVTLKVTSNNNEDFAVEATTNHANSVSLACEVFPLNNELVTFTTSHSFAGQSHTHTCSYGVATSGTGGNSGDHRTRGRHFISDGSIASPSLVFENDHNTGIYRVGSDQIGWVSGGSRKFYTNASRAYFQNLSEGVDVPSLRISGTTVIDSSRNLTNIGRITATDNTYQGGIFLSPASGSSYITANRATDTTGQVGFGWYTGGSMKWVNYLDNPNPATNTMHWYASPTSSNVMSLTTGGNLDIGGHFTFSSSNHRWTAGSSGAANNILGKIGTTGAAGIALKDSANVFRIQIYGEGSTYGFLASEWGGWDLKKTNNGRLTFNGNDTYFLQPEHANSAKFRQFVNIGDSSSYNTNSGSWGARLNVTDDVHAKIEVGQDADGMLSHWYAHTGHTAIKFGTSSAHNVDLQRAGSTSIQIQAGGTLFYVPIRRNSHHASGFLEGSYNNVGANGVKTNPIYTIGSSYNPAETSLSNMYGIGYARGDASYLSSFTGASNWGMYVAADGDARIWLDAQAGQVMTTGGYRVGSTQVINSSGAFVGSLSPTTLTVLGGSADWNETTPGTSTGSIHLDPENATNNYGSAITWGASDTANGTTAHAGIYVRSDGNYGTKMYIATTDSYALGSKTSIKIDHAGHVEIKRGNLYLTPGRMFNIDGGPSTPAYSFNNDSDTGMYRNASNDMGFATAGASRFRINNDGLTADSNSNIRGTTDSGIYTYHSSIGGFVLKPGGAQYTTSTGTVTGAIKIQLPVYASNDMISFWVDIYDYRGGTTTSYFIGGYVYQGEGNNEWVNESAICIAEESNTTTACKQVRFGVQSNKHCIWIGETDTTWKYPQIVVRDFQGGYATNIDEWADGWSITTVTSFGTVDHTRATSGPRIGNEAGDVQVKRDLYVNGNSSRGQIGIEAAGANRGYVYADTSNNIGFLDNSGHWAIRHLNHSGTEFRQNNSVIASIGAGQVGGDYGSMVVKDTKNGWGGYSINNRAVFMHDNANATGIYNDVDNEWFAQFQRNGSSYIYTDGHATLQTLTSGIQVNSSSGESTSQVRMYTNGTLRGYFYADTSNNIGILDAGGSWAIRHINDQGTEFRTDNSTVTAAIGADLVSGSFGSMVVKDTKSGWGGYSINNRVVFMHDNANTAGIYNDVNNHWMVRTSNGGEVQLYHNGVQKMQTFASGISIDGQYRTSAVAGEYSGNPRSLTIGFSGGNYGQIGYGWTPTATSGVHTSALNDIQSRMDFYDGIRVYSSNNSTVSVGTTVSWTQILDARSGTFTYKGNTIWHAGNDGPSSGLDADTVDGIQAASTVHKVGNSGYYQANTWINFSSAGLYWGSGAGSGQHIYPTSSYSMRFQSGHNSVCQLELNTNNNTRGYVYADNSNQIGFLNNSGNWVLKVVSAGSAYLGGTSQMRINSSSTTGIVESTATNFVLRSSGGGVISLQNSSATAIAEYTNAGNYSNVDGHSTFYRTAGAPVILDRLGTTGTSGTFNGEILNFRTAGTKRGEIGYKAFAYGDSPYFATYDWGLGFFSYQQSRYIQPCDGSGAIRDNQVDLGSTSARFDDVYATNGTIQTSDRNEKQDIQALTDAETRVATACKSLIRRYRWISSVEEKGDDARYHFGAIAQDVEAAFTAEGLDAGDYALFISSTWWEHEGESYPTAEAAPTGAVEKTRLGIRYNQLFAFIISAL